MTRRIGDGRRRTATAAAACALLGAGAVGAQSRGVYPLGMSATNAGVMPAEGFTYANQLLFYARDEAKDDDGGTLPVAGSNVVVMDMNSVIWVSRRKLLGARYAATVTVPIAKNSLTSDVEGDISGGGGLADTYVLPVILGWERGRAAVRAMYGVLVPTGRFEAEASDNVGSGYWTHTLSSGQTVHLTERRTLTLSAFEVYEFHTTQEGTDVRPGETLNVDYSLMGTLPRWRAVIPQAGIAGYLQRQTTAKRGPAVDAAAAASRYAVNGLGVALGGAFPDQEASVGLKYIHEFANRSTFQGYTVQLAGTISF